MTTRDRQLDLPVFVLSTGRAGSTMISNMLKLHPDILSLSEFFSFLGTGVFRHRRLTGDRMWHYCSRCRRHAQIMLQGQFGELLYPVDDPAARFDRTTTPPILCTALPHLTQAYEALFDELEPVVRQQPKQSPADHLRHLFGWLAQRFGKRVWVERSGATLLVSPMLLRQFPEAKVVHLVRDGRDSAVSMSTHYLFRMIVAGRHKFRRRGVDVVSLVSKLGERDRLNAWTQEIASWLINPQRLPYDKLGPRDFGEFWDLTTKLGQGVIDKLDPDRVLGVRFEDILAHPERELRRIARFIDPSLESEAWLAQATPIPRPVPSKFAKLSAEDQEAVTAACRSGLTMLGYV